jgi:hypothetical protein
MPTYDVTPRFWLDYRHLTSVQQRALDRAVQKFVFDLRQGKFRKGLRVKLIQGAEDLYEMTWADDGRATFQFGPARRKGYVHVIWRQCETHAVAKHP